MKPKRSTYGSPKMIHAFDKLPVEIQVRATKIIQHSLGACSVDAEFNIAMLYDLEACCLPEEQEIRYTPVPRYNLHYMYVSPQNSKEQYCFELDFDIYGQVLKYGLPRNGSYTVAVLNGRAEAVKQAARYAATKGYKTKSVGEQLFHDSFQDCLIWQVLLVQHQIQQDGQLVKYCRAIAMDILSGWIYYDRAATVGGQRQNTFVCIEYRINDPSEWA